MSDWSRDTNVVFGESRRWKLCVSLFVTYYVDTAAAVVAADAAAVRLYPFISADDVTMLILSCRIQISPALSGVMALFSIGFIMSRLQSVQNAAARLVTWQSALRPHNAGAPSTTLAGYRYAGASISRLPHSFIGCCWEILRHTYTDDCRLVAGARERRLYAPQRVGHASLPGPTAPLVTELLQLPVPGYGTVYCHISEMLIADLPYSRFRRSLKTFLFG